MTEENSLPLKVDVAGGVGWITLNRPRSINSVNNAIRNGMQEALPRLDNNEAVKVIVIRGAGERGFCVGADVKEFTAPETPVQTRNKLARPSWIETLDTTRKPVIAAIHGYCLGGGLELALACDLRVASSDAIFGLPEIKLGLMPGGGGTQRLSRIVGMGRALDMVLTGENLPAMLAHEIGLISRMWDTRDALFAGTEALANSLAEKSSVALSYIKEAVVAGNELGLRSGLRLEKDLFGLLMGSEERIAATKAFKQKNKSLSKSDRQTTTKA